MRLPGLGGWHEDPLWSYVYPWLVEHDRVGGAAWRAGTGSDLALLRETADEIGTLPRGARVLDVPTGSGVALRGLRPGQGIDYVADLALLLLATNLFNLLDLRPGRVEKVFVALLAGLCLGAWTANPLELLGIFIGPVLVVGVFTLRERAMLGDTGSNLVGALAGVAMLVTLGETGRWIALALVASLTIFGEFRSISKTVESIPPLRWIDSLGRVSEGDLKR